jgi:hypothetical protein
MTQHPHAEVLRAIADGVPLSEFEGSVACGRFVPLGEACWNTGATSTGWIGSPNEWRIRRKQKTIKVNGFDVPEPCRGVIQDGTDVYLMALDASGYCIPKQWRDTSDFGRWRQRGLVHFTEEAAIAHAKAMLNINPKEDA